MAPGSGPAEVLEDDGLTSRFGAEWIRRRQSGGPPDAAGPEPNGQETPPGRAAVGVFRYACPPTRPGSPCRLHMSQMRMTLRYAYPGDREIEAEAERIGQEIAEITDIPHAIA